MLRRKYFIILFVLTSLIEGEEIPPWEKETWEELIARVDEFVSLMIRDVDVMFIGRVVKVRENPDDIFYPREIWLVPDSIIWASEIKDTYYVKVKSGRRYITLENGRKILAKMWYDYEPEDTIFPFFRPPYSLKEGEKGIFGLSSEMSLPGPTNRMKLSPFSGASEYLFLVYISGPRKSIEEYKKENFGFYFLGYKLSFKGDSLIHIPEAKEVWKKMKGNEIRLFKKDRRGEQLRVVEKNFPFENIYKEHFRVKRDLFFKILEIQFPDKEYMKRYGEICKKVNTPEVNVDIDIIEQFYASEEASRERLWWDREDTFHRIMREKGVDGVLEFIKKHHRRFFKRALKKYGTLKSLMEKER